MAYSVLGSLPLFNLQRIQQLLTFIIDETIMIYESLEGVGTVNCLLIFDGVLPIRFLQGIKLGTIEFQSVFGNRNLSL